MKLSGFLITMLIVGLFATVFATFYANIGTEYPVTYDNQSKNNLTVFNKFDDLNSNVEDIEAQLFEEQEASGITDLVGKFLGAGFNTLKLAFSSVSTFYELANEAFTGVPVIGEATDTFKNVLIAVVSVIVLFIIISALIGRDV